MDDVTPRLIKFAPFCALYALSRTNRAASRALYDVDLTRFTKSANHNRAYVNVLPNGVVHGPIRYYTLCCVTMNCERGRALSIRVDPTSGPHNPTTIIDLHRSLIIRTGPDINDIPTDVITCASGVQLTFRHEMLDRVALNGVRRQTVEPTSLMRDASAKSVDEWIADNMICFDAEVRSALTNRRPDRLISCMRERRVVICEPLDRMWQMMTSPLPTPTVMRVKGAATRS